MIEDYPLRNPHIHKNTDRLTTLDPVFLTSNSRALLAITYTLANALIKVRS